MSEKIKAFIGQKFEEFSKKTDEDEASYFYQLTLDKIKFLEKEICHYRGFQTILSKKEKMSTFTASLYEFFQSNSESVNIAWNEKYETICINYINQFLSPDYSYKCPTISENPEQIDYNQLWMQLVAIYFFYYSALSGFNFFPFTIYYRIDFIMTQIVSTVMTHKLNMWKYGIDQETRVEKSKIATQKKIEVQENYVITIAKRVSSLKLYNSLNEVKCVIDKKITDLYKLYKNDQDEYIKLKETDPDRYLEFEKKIPPYGPTKIVEVLQRAIDDGRLNIHELLKPKKN